MTGSILKAVSALLLAWLIGGGQALPSQGASAEPAGVGAIRAGALIDALGVNVHVEYTDGKYRNVQTVIDCLSYLGFHHVRDSTLNPKKRGQKNYDRLAEAGIRLTLIAPGGQPLSDALLLLRNFVLTYPGAVSAIEGPNEINNWPVSHKGRTGDEAAVELQNDLYAGVTSDAVFEGIPVYHMTGPPGVVGKGDFANVHPYPRSGDQPRAMLTKELARHLAFMPGYPAVITETGYYTLPAGPGWEGVDYDTQAKLTLNLIFDAVEMGVRRIFLYELLDAYPDPDGKRMLVHFGLFDIDYQPKPVAIALHNLTSILRDTGTDAATFSPGRLEYSVAGLSPEGRSLLFEKSSGVFDIVVWDEPDIWDETADRPLVAEPREVRIDLGGTFGEVRIYDPLVGATPVDSHRDVAAVKIEVSDHPVIIEVGDPEMEPPTLGGSSGVGQ